MGLEKVQTTVALQVYFERIKNTSLDFVFSTIKTV